MEENITDRISELPGFVIHHILSYLDSPKDLVRMSILSNYWFELTASFPILNFNFLDFKEVIQSSGIPVKDKMDIFLKYVEYTVCRLCEQNVSVHTFKLVMSFTGPSEAGIIERCLGLILEKGVKVLVIDVPFVQQPYQMQRVPNILLSASTLTCMKNNKCELPSFLMVDVIFKSLKMLHLHNVPLNEEMIKRLTTSCPVLELLDVNNCYGFKRFCIYGHLSLQQVAYFFGPEVERIEIDAPNLWSLRLNDCNIDETGVPPYMNLASCKKLTRVRYRGSGLPDLSSNFPFLEDLFLVLPDECKTLHVSSHSLRTLMLHSKCKLDKIDIDSPNLQLLCFKDDSHFNSRMETNTTPSKACVNWDREVFINGRWFQKLRQFLDKKIWFKELKLHIYVGSIYSIEPEVMQRPPIEFEHVELEAEWFEYINFYLLVVDSLLWCCRPRSLTLIIDFSLLEFEEWESVVKHTYEKLLEQEDQAHTSIQFVMSSSSSKDKMNFSDLSTLLKALPRDGSKQTITFIKSGRQLFKKQEEETVKSK